jgi:hypothetical protein
MELGERGKGKEKNDRPSVISHDIRCKVYRI